MFQFAVNFVSAGEVVLNVILYAYIKQLLRQQFHLVSQNN